MQKPVAFWIPKAEQFCLPPKDGTTPFAKAWQPLFSVPVAEPLQQEAKVWCQYIAGMIDCYLRTMPDENEIETAIAGIIERRLKHLGHATTSGDRS